jgi:hypothetical protein
LFAHPDILAKAQSSRCYSGGCRRGRRRGSYRRSDPFYTEPQQSSYIIDTARLISETPWKRLKNPNGAAVVIVAAIVAEVIVMEVLCSPRRPGKGYLVALVFVVVMCSLHPVLCARTHRQKCFVAAAAACFSHEARAFALESARFPGRNNVRTMVSRR